MIWLFAEALCTQLMTTPGWHVQVAPWLSIQNMKVGQHFPRNFPHHRVVDTALFTYVNTTTVETYYRRSVSNPSD